MINAPKRTILLILALLAGVVATPVHAGGTVTLCTVNALQAALSGGGTVQFQTDCSLPVPEIVISTDTTLDANGHTVTLSGGGTHRVFTVSPGVQFTITGITVTGGSAAQGGGIFNDGGTLTLQDEATVSGNTATESGGGVANSVNGVLVVRTGTQVSGNSSAGTGGGIANRGTVVLTDTGTAVSGNTATTDGGGIFNDASANTYVKDGSAVSGNTSTGRGGGLFNQGFMVISAGGTHIDSNHALTDGGGVYNASTVIVETGAAVSGNSADGSGGGIASQGDVTITGGGTTVDANTAGQDGGGLWIEPNSSGRVEAGAVVSGNTASGSGGGLRSDGALTVSGGGTSVDDNHALIDGGGVYSAGSLAVNAGAVILSNQAGASGGGVYNAGSLTVSGSSTLIGDNGAAAGGGIFNTASGSARVETGADVTANTATTTGGGALNQGSLTLFGSGTTVYGNEAGSDGGGVLNQGVLMVLAGAQITANEAGGDGGGVLNAGNLTVSDSGTVIGSNNAVSGAGLVNTASGSARLDTGAVVSGNTSTGGGAGILNAGTLTLSGGGTQVSGNHAALDGGGIDNQGVLRVEAGATVSGNQTDASGGGLRNSGLFTISGTGTAISGNTSALDGGGAFNQGTLSLEAGAAIADNTASGSGGGIFNGGTFHVLTTARVTGNAAGAQGGGIFNSGTTGVSYGVIQGNTAVIDGGAYVSGHVDSTDTIHASCIVANSHTGVLDIGGGVLDAEDNWWGASNGPGAGDTMGANISAANYLTAPVLGCPVTSVSLSGRVYADTDSSGSSGPSEPGLSGVTITLTGTHALGSVNEVAITGPDGAYSFDPLRAGTYTLTETQPDGMLDGLESVGTLGGSTATNDVIADINATTPGSVGLNYNFGEDARVPHPLSPNSKSTSTDSTPTLTWSSPVPYASYQIQIAQTSDFSWPVQKGVSDTTSYTARALGNSLFYWRVRGLSGDGTPSFWSTAYILKIDAVPLTPPRLLYPQQGASLSNPRFRWELGRSSYRLQVAADANFTVPVVDETLARTRYQVPLLPGVYYWRVSAVDDDGSLSAWSETIRFTVTPTVIVIPVPPTEPPPPVLVTPQQPPLPPNRITPEPPPTQSRPGDKPDEPQPPVANPGRDQPKDTTNPIKRHQ